MVKIIMRITKNDNRNGNSKNIINKKQYDPQ